MGVLKRGLMARGLGPGRNRSKEIELGIVPGRVPQPRHTRRKIELATHDTALFKTQEPRGRKVKLSAPFSAVLTYDTPCLLIPSDGIWTA